MAFIQRMKNTYFYLLLFLISFIILSYNAGGLMLYSLDEAKNAEAAREMLEQGEWVVPTFNYELRTDKPPAHYYFMMLSYSIFGVNEWAARFFSAIMGSATILLTFWFGARYFNRQTGVWAAMALLASLHFNIQFHMSVPDPYLICFFTASLFFFYAYWKEQKSTFLWAFYFFMAMGVMSKGPVAIALPGLAILLFLIFTKNFSLKNILSFKPFHGLLLILTICLPWYLAVHFQTDGQWTQEFFFKHNLNRYAAPMEGHGGLFLITPMIVLIGMLPASAFFIQSFKLAWQKRKEPAILFISIVTLTVVVFFSTSGTKLPNYTMPSYPFFALMLGYYFSQAVSKNQLNKIATIFLAVLGFAMPIGGYLVLQGDKYLSHLPFVAAAFVPLAIGGILSLYYLKGKQIQRSLITITLSWIVTACLFFGWAYPQIDQENPVAKTLPELDLDKDFYHYKRVNAAYIFYLKKPVPQLAETAEIQSLIESGKSFYLITRRSYDEELAGIVGLEKILEAKDIFETPFTTIYEAKGN